MECMPHAHIPYLPDVPVSFKVGDTNIVFIFYEVRAKWRECRCDMAHGTQTTDSDSNVVNWCENMKEISSQW
jgi:hypothetical protein